MERTVAMKMGLKPGTRAYLIDGPAASVEAMNLPDLNIPASLTGQFAYIHLFTTTQQHLDEMFPQVKQHLAANGMLWISWPKGRQQDTDLTLPIVIRIGYSHGLVESKTLSIDSTWSALKFTFPKPGKTYRNSYGQLPT